MIFLTELEISNISLIPKHSAFFFFHFRFFLIYDPLALCMFQQSDYSVLCFFKNEIIAEKVSICDEIIYTQSHQINNQLSREWYQFIRNPLNQTLDSEHDNLIATNLE